jgi:hypothetical protein
VGFQGPEAPGNDDRDDLEVVRAALLSAIAGLRAFLDAAEVLVNDPVAWRASASMLKDLANRLSGLLDGGNS